MRFSRLTLTSVFTFLGFSICAQTIISVEDVVSLAMQKNYDVRTSQNSAALALNDNRYAFGAFLPQINATGTYTKNTNNTRNITFLDVETKRTNVPSNTMTGSAQFVWTIFDGTKMFALRKRYNQLAELGELNLRNQMINSAALTIANYYGIVRQKQQLKALGELRSVSEERVKLAEKKLQVGTGGKPELLQAKVDLNAIRTNVIAQETLIQQLKDIMNGTLAMSLPDGYEVSDTIPINLNLNIDEIMTDIENTNRQLAAQRKTIEVAEQLVKENRRSRWFTVNLLSSYNYNKTENELQANPFSLKLTSAQGYNYGASVVLPIMNGMNVSRLVNQSKINLDRQKLLYEQQMTLVLVGVRTAFINYDNSRKTLIIEEENILLARENVDIALASFRRGIATFIELRTAQQSLADAYNRLIAARFSAKIAEVELFRLKGSVLQ